ncbi:tetratricopeptide repeat protein [Acinetobacter wuhouensis]|uniref:Tetratricopeptide repeat protein n=1 Tax=Acinetobacter wuhouensis TaxID=1879050 RepID=A0A3G2T765_9GAMM|nr:tetratricopeptide repeat protein [Acinetobacter wuhouensis]AYO55842.1 tetratricopeptide repeat protein [Acinetobacter wuhouensis]
MKMKLPLPKPPNNMHKQMSTAELNKKLDLASKAFRSALARNNFEEAYQKILPAHQILPQHPSILMDLAYTELRLHKFDLAYDHYKKAIKYSGAKVDPNIYDGLAEVCHFLNKKDELVQYGRLALETKKNMVSNEPILKHIQTPPEAFNPHQPKENIIAFSLFGNLARYCETSIINVDLVKEIYPEWTCRFYVNDTVTDLVKQRLREKGAEVVEVTQAQNQLSGLFWRFFVMDDPTVKRFLIRDADSLVSYREKAAVDAWLKSDKWFHTMHDSYSHTELILAGMWGGCYGMFENIEQLIRDFIVTGRFSNTRVIDQHFLRYAIWSTIKQSVLIHDSQSFEVDAMPFPKHEQYTGFEDLSQFHIGMNEGSGNLKLGVKFPNQKQVFWTLLDENEQQVCRYIADVTKDQQIILDVPRSYARQIEKQNWKIQVDLFENNE